MITLKNDKLFVKHQLGLNQDEEPEANTKVTTTQSPSKITVKTPPQTSPQSGYAQGLVFKPGRYEACGFNAIECRQQTRKMVGFSGSSVFYEAIFEANGRGRINNNSSKFELSSPFTWKVDPQNPAAVIATIGQGGNYRSPGEIMTGKWIEPGIFHFDDHLLHPKK